MTIPYDSVEGRARYIDQAILYVDARESWKVGDFGQTIAEYRAITYQGVPLSDAIGVVALAVDKTADGYTLYATSSSGTREFYSARLDHAGSVLEVRALDDRELIQTEIALGTDLNGNGGIGGGTVLYTDSQELDISVNELGQLCIDNGLGTLVPLFFGGAAVTVDTLGDALDITDVLATSNGYQVWVADYQGNVVQVGFSTGGHSSTVTALTPEQVRAAEAARNVDLNNRTDTPLTEGWTAMLQTEAVRGLVEQLSADGQRLGHADLVNIVATAIASVPPGQQVGAALVGDLRAIAARGQALFGQDAESADYLSFVFDQMVSTSRANNFYTGGQTRASALGSLNAESSAEQLQKLGGKWLLGLDLPNPTTEGDTANPEARAATGVYKVFDAPLFGSAGPQFTDVNQGSAGTCYLMASAAAVAHSKPGAIEAVFVSNGANALGQQTYGVRLYDGRGQTHWVTVNNQLVVASAEDDVPLYSKLANTLTPQDTKLWLPLLEKAYAQMNEQGFLGREAMSNGKNAMWAIEGGFSEAGSYILGTGSWTYSDDAEDVGYQVNHNPLTTVQLLPEGLSDVQVLARYLNGGNTLFVGSSANTHDADQRILFTEGHAYIIMDADPADAHNTTVTVYNPWGSTTPDNPNYVAPFAADMADLVGVEGLSFWLYDF